MARLAVALALSTLAAGAAITYAVRVTSDGAAHRPVTWIVSYAVAALAVGAVVVLTGEVARRRYAQERGGALGRFIRDGETLRAQIEQCNGWPYESGLDQSVRAWNEGAREWLKKHSHRTWPFLEPQMNLPKTEDCDPAELAAYMDQKLNYLRVVERGLED